MDVRNLRLPQGLACADEAALRAKLARFRTAGLAKLHLVFDFDRTLTVGSSVERQDVTTWQILGADLPAAGRARYQALYEHYRPLEVSGAITPAEVVAWTTEVLDLLAALRLDMHEVERHFLAATNVRPGAQEVLKWCDRRGVPTIILSAGIRQVIELWMRAYGLAPTMILANSLMLDGEGRVQDWEKASLIHLLNKQEVDHPELERIRAERPMVLLVGDSLEDAVMAGGDETVARLRIYDPRLDEATPMEEVQRQTWTRFDALMTGGNLEPVLELLEQLV